MKLASIPGQSYHASMNRRFRTLLAFALVAHLVAIAAMAVCPRLHEWAHHDADDDDHDCAIMLFASGAANASAAPAVLPVVTLECVEILRGEEARQIFLARAEGRIRERAPPARGV